eukprot:261220_1
MAPPLPHLHEIGVHTIVASRPHNRRARLSCGGPQVDNPLVALVLSCWREILALVSVAPQAVLALLLRLRRILVVEKHVVHTHRKVIGVENGAVDA